MSGKKKVPSQQFFLSQSNGYCTRWHSMKLQIQRSCLDVGTWEAFLQAACCSELEQTATECRGSHNCHIIQITTRQDMGIKGYAYWAHQNQSHSQSQSHTTIIKNGDLLLSSNAYRYLTGQCDLIIGSRSRTTRDAPTKDNITRSQKNHKRAHTRTVTISLINLNLIWINSGSIKIVYDYKAEIHGTGSRVSTLRKTRISYIWHQYFVSFVFVMGA